MQDTFERTDELVDTETGEQAYPVPSEDQFRDSYREANDLQRIAYELIMEHHELSHLSDYNISYLWRKKGGTSKQRPVFGNVQLARGLLTYYTEADALLWVSADHLKQYRFSEHQVRALMYSLLLRLDEDEEHEGNAILKVIAPEVSVFSNEIRHYGVWWPDPESFESAVKQLDLFAGQAN